ncbi:aquaporin-5-like [Haliotis rufescens]|uniref:aquaporin-5-like n=1 Tax=Haliotis rufescens TaxID=6454 RepID=UPI001EAFDC02|nr:aquaporin-5-like [Haliotis rufescens]
MSSGLRTNDTCLSRARMVTSLDDIQSLRFWKAIAAEFLGTLLLVFVGCGSCVSKEANIVSIALCFGLSVATIVWMICHVSGGHINPAVTAAMLATRKISLARAVFYVIFQLLGSIVGAGLLYGLKDAGGKGLGLTQVNEKIDPGRAVGIELFITLVLVFTVFASVDSKRKDLNGSTPLTIGLSVTMCHLFAIPFTGSSMNTARSFGPAVVMWEWTHHWVYWVGPIIGGVAAGLIYEHVFAVNASMTKAKACMLSSSYDDEKYEAQKLKIRILEEDDVETINLKDAEAGAGEGEGGKSNHDDPPVEV